MTSSIVFFFIHIENKYILCLVLTNNSENDYFDEKNRNLQADEQGDGK